MALLATIAIAIGLGFPASVAARFFARFGVREDVAVTSPQGVRALVTKAEARRRIELYGWRYEEPSQAGDDAT
ncbi:MAG TPA: hypothetical protein VIP57_16670 [Candidatus Dormibacteraeota bacterium]